MKKQKDITTLQAELEQAEKKYLKQPNSPYLMDQVRKTKRALDKRLFVHLAQKEVATPPKDIAPLKLFVVVVGTDPLKYRIKEAFIRKFGSEQAVKVAKEKMPGIPASTIEYHMNIRMSEQAIISDAKLLRYAEYTGLQIDYLKADYMYHLSQTKKLPA